MSLARRAREVFIGILMFLMAGVMAFLPGLGYLLVEIALSFVLILAGIRRLVYYFSMARHMVSGKVVLYSGVILLDLGLLSFGISAIPQVYVMLSLLSIHLFDGVISVARAREQKIYKASSWKLKMASGVVNIVIALLCAAFIKSLNVAVYIYAFGLAWSAVLRIATALRQTDIVYIQ